MKNKLQIIPIIDIVVDETLYPRLNVDFSTVQRYSSAMKSGANFQPIKVVKRIADNKYVIIDGKHRLEATKQNGEKFIQAEVLKGYTKKQLYEIAVEANISHGKQFTTQEINQISIHLKDMDYTLKEISNIVRLPMDDIKEFFSISSRMIHVISNAGIKKLTARYSSNEDNEESEEENKEEKQDKKTPVQISNPQLKEVLVIELIDNLISALRSDDFNTDDKKIIEKIKELQELINYYYN